MKITNIIADQVDVENTTYLRLSMNRWYRLKNISCDYERLDYREAKTLEAKYQIQNKQDFLDDKYA